MLHYRGLTPALKVATANFCFLMSSLWNIRNTACNFRYTQYEENRSELRFYYKLGDYECGYHTEESDPKRAGSLGFLS